MRRTLDSADICQSVFANFFVKATLGDLEFDRPEHLLRLLSQMVRNKLIDRHRRHQVRQPQGTLHAQTKFEDALGLHFETVFAGRVSVNERQTMLIFVPTCPNTPPE